MLRTLALGGAAEFALISDHRPSRKRRRHAGAARGTQQQHPRDTLLHAVRELVLKSFLHFSDEHAGAESAGESTAETQG